MMNPENVKKAAATRKLHINDPPPVAHLCECGCGEYAKPGNRFVCGHTACKTPWCRPSEPQLCECGCGEYTNPGKKFVHGHHLRGKELPQERKDKISASNKGVPKSKSHIDAMIEAKLREKTPLLNGWDTCPTMNKECTNYIGDITERILSMLYENVHIMPRGNHGYDMVCNCGIKVDAKGSATGHLGRWSFNIKKNTLADYFLCIGFDDQHNTHPQHAWMIPGQVVNHLVGLRICKTKLDKWQQYEITIEDVINSRNIVCTQYGYDSPVHTGSTT